MEYFAGSLLTLVTMYIVARLVRQPKYDVKRVKTMFSQTRQYELTADFIPVVRKKIDTQSSKHQQSQYTRIVFIGDTAYWIEEGTVYSSEFRDGMVDYENKIKVDMMAMDKVELDKMAFVVERLTEGLTNDSGNSGN